MTASSYQFVIERIAIAKDLDGLVDDLHADKHLSAADRYELVILLGRKLKALRMAGLKTPIRVSSVSICG